MESNIAEIRAQIDKLRLDLKFKKYQYKNAFEKDGGWDEAKKLHAEIKATEIEISNTIDELKKRGENYASNNS